MSFRSRTRTGIFYVPGFPKGVKWLLIVPSASVLVDGSRTAAVPSASEIRTAAEEQLAGGV